MTKTQNEGHAIDQDWLSRLTLEKTRAHLAKERETSKSMLLLIEFARTTIDNNETIVLYFEPVFNLFSFFFFHSYDQIALEI